MHPWPTQDSQDTSSHTPPTASSNRRQHGLPRPDEPRADLSRPSRSECQGSAAANEQREALLLPGGSPLNAQNDTEVTGIEPPLGELESLYTSKHDNSGKYEPKWVVKAKKETSIGLHMVDLPNGTSIALLGATSTNRVEILTHVLSYLPAETLSAAALVCHRFHQLVTTPHAWRDAFLRYFPGSPVSSLRQSDARETPVMVHGGRLFTRLTALASWRSEYILRTRLLRSLARGKPPAFPPNSIQQASKQRLTLGPTLFESQQVDIVDRIHGDFGSGIDGRRPRFRYGTTYVSRLGHSDPANNAPDAWGLREANIFSRFDRDFFGMAQPFGLGAGEILGTSNPMDISQPFGAIHGEGIPGGRVFFHHAQEKEGRFLNLTLPSAASATAGVPYIDPEHESICSVWIAKNANVPAISNGILGMLSGASTGVLTAYSLGTDGVAGRRLQRGEITARWAICPGVPITSIKVDDSYSMKRYGRNRILVLILNALGEVYYLKDIFARPENNLPDKPTEDDINSLAWETGRSVKWGLIGDTTRVAQEADGNITPRSSWFGAGLTQEQVKRETADIERYIRKKPKHFRELCFGWDMQRRIEVDFGGDDENGAGESALVFECGVKDGMSMPLRATRHTRRLIESFKSDAEAPSTHTCAISQDGSEEMVYGDPDPEADKWMQSDFTFGSIDSEVVTTTIDASSFATLTLDEDPLLNLSASTLSSPWASPAGAMPRPENIAEIPGHRARLVAAGTNQGAILLWDIRAPTAPSAGLKNTILPLRIIRTDSPAISCLGLTALYLVHGGTDGLVQAWDPLGSVAGPVRTLNSRYSIRSRHRFVMAGTTPDRAGYEFFVAGGISLDPDATSLRGMVTLGSLLRYWHFSSDAAEQYRRSKRRWRRHQRSSNQQRDAEASFIGRGASMKYYIADEMQEMEAEQRANQRQQERLADRFGVGLLGPGATESEMLAYATLLSNEAEERRNFGRALTPPPVGGSLDFVQTQEAYLPSADADVDEAIRRSLQESSEQAYVVRYKSDRPTSPRTTPGGASCRKVAGSSRSPDADMEFALQLSLAEEQSREEGGGAGSSYWETADDFFISEAPANAGKGKGKAR